MDRSIGGGRPRVYLEAERKLIDPYKAEYMSTTTPSQRKNLAQTHIFPDLFNYWESKGLDLNPAEINSRSNELLKWLRNVWRVKRSVGTKPGTRYRLTDILWWTRKDRVFVEIASLLNLESANTSTPGWFQLRTKASKNILDSMTEDERKEIEDEADRMQRDGLPREVQRCIAEDKWYSRLTASAKTHYRDMSLVQLSICIYTGVSGDLHVDIHDEIAKFLGVPALPFDAMYPEKALEMKKMVLDYIKVLRRAHFDLSQNSADENVNALPRIRLDLDPDNFPIAPRPTSWSKVTKVELEPIYRLYMKQHYQLACRDKDRQAPFEKISANNLDFIEAEFLPPGIKLTDPRSMKLDALIKFFQHISRREDSHGIQNAFRFEHVSAGRKHGTLHRARYKVDGDQSSDHSSTPVRRKRRKPAKVSINTDIFDNDLAVELDPTASTYARDNETLPATSQNTAPLASPRPAGLASSTANNPVGLQTPSDTSAGLASSTANNPTGLQTPSDTPAREENGSLSPAPRNRAKKKSKNLQPITDSASPRRSSRTSGRANPNTIPNHTSKKKSRK